ncbi:glucose-6-phosphate isomerase [Phorcysia thermohydrogeniphila]|uniref:Glucose-6-phosphate isomerase n=1 Tax=Phorcysia thermohydrogeniphila TaxID=936138 RepID=A0A4R1GH00_9BACT|nr:glucose-6-phosphate isomerase [Phorcysia thermohydrogeniphila]TCK06261.1 glucose-6-phosphate isomerase [Phorcysia thermohydrogeniphila]
MGVGVSFDFAGYTKEHIEEVVEKEELPLLINPKDMPFIRFVGEEELLEIERTAEKLREYFSTLVVVGMGGSSLGSMALHDALCYKAKRELLFLDNVDPLLISRTLKKLDLGKTLFVFVSKSGRTLETVAILNVVLEKLRNEVPNFEKHLLFIGDLGKSFERLASRVGSPFLPVPEEVGGRFSVFTSVALFPAAFVGYDIRTFIGGAQRAVKEAEVGLKLGACKFLHYLEGRINSVLVPYSNYLREFTEWYAQLWGESLGKDGKGQTPVKAIGTPSRHSVFQLFMDGPDDKVYQFFLIKRYPEDLVLPRKTEILPFLAGKRLSEVMEAEFKGALRALRERGRPLIVFEIPELSEFELGYLFMTYMIATVGMARLMKVNPYGQPAVEIGKKFALEELRKGE